MKYLKILFALSLAFTLNSLGYASNVDYTFAPFHHVEVKKGEKLHVAYRFDAHRETLVCREEEPNHAINSVEWKYKNATRRLNLPVTLKDDANFEGFWADPIGILVITNDFGAMPPNRSIYVSCVYIPML